MPNRELVERFIAHAPDFHDDLSAPDIDHKHSSIVQEAYRQFAQEDVAADFRSWKQQGDLSVPAQFSQLLSGNPARNLLRYAYRKTLGRASDNALRQGVLDDVAIIEMAGGADLLEQNPVHKTPGAREWYFVNGTSVNLRWLRYIYLLKRIMSFGLRNGAVWVDVGSYYGGLQGLVRKYRPDARIVMVDFHHQLCRAYLYLHSQYPEARHVLPDEIVEGVDLATLPEGSIAYVPARNYARVANQGGVDLASNFFSFGEMRRETYRSYADSRVFREAEHAYLVNRFVSAPAYEGTYDSDLTVFDYREEGRRITSFDIFPIHHYLQIQRELFGRTYPRNPGSPYFEMLTARG